MDETFHISEKPVGHNLVIILFDGATISALTIQRHRIKFAVLNSWLHKENTSVSLTNVLIRFFLLSIQRLPVRRTGLVGTVLTSVTVTTHFIVIDSMDQRTNVNVLMVTSVHHFVNQVKFYTWKGEKCEISKLSIQLVNK